MKESIIKIALATVLLIAAVIIEKKTDWPTWAYLLIYLIPYLIVGWETLKEAGEALVHGEALDENFLMSVATLGALAIGFLPGAETPSRWASCSKASPRAGAASPSPI